MMRSSACGALPAAAMAWRAAASARSQVVCTGAAIWRSRIPVRSRIHASVVSTCILCLVLVFLCLGCLLFVFVFFVFFFLCFLFCVFFFVVCCCVVVLS